jgi:hypothetical protein
MTITQWPRPLCQNVCACSVRNSVLSPSLCPIARDRTFWNFAHRPIYKVGNSWHLQGYFIVKGSDGKACLLDWYWKYIWLIWLLFKWLRRVKCGSENTVRLVGLSIVGLQDIQACLSINGRYRNTWGIFKNYSDQLDSYNTRLCRLIISYNIYCGLYNVK